MKTKKIARAANAAPSRTKSTAGSKGHGAGKFSMSLGLALAMSAGGQTALADVFESAGNGCWFAGTTWTKTSGSGAHLVPGPGDTATIMAGHIVSQYAPSCTSLATICVDSLGIGGTLTSHPTTGGTPLQLEVAQLVITPGGLIMGQNGTSVGSPGSDITITAKPGVPFLFTNFGDVLAGHGFSGSLAGRGGNIIIDATGASSSRIIAAEGDLIAGNSPASAWWNTTVCGGDVIIIVDQLELQGTPGDPAQIIAGDTDYGRPPTGCQSCAGDVHITASQTINLADGSFIKGGDYIGGGSPDRVGGNVTLTAGTSFFSGPGSVIQSGLPWVEGRCCSEATVLSTNIVMDGWFLSGCFFVDPPDVILTECLEVESNRSVFAGQNITVDSLDLADAVESETIEFYVNPGGRLTFTNLDPDKVYFRATTEINIRVDPENIILGPGLTLDGIFSPAPTMLPAEPFRSVSIAPPSTIVLGTPGQAQTINGEVRNAGSATETFRITVMDTHGWVAPLSIEVMLDAVQAFDLPLQIAVPADAMPGDQSDIVISAVNVSSPAANRESTISVVVPGGPPPCYADCDGSGALDIFDFLCFSNAFSAGDLSADCDGSGALDIFDFLCFSNAFSAGCP